jgi:hypothetical protein
MPLIVMIIIMCVVSWLDVDVFALDYRFWRLWQINIVDVAGQGGGPDEGKLPPRDQPSHFGRLL